MTTSDIRSTTKSKNASKTAPLSQQKQLHNKRIFDPRSKAHSYSTVFSMGLFRDVCHSFTRCFTKRNLQTTLP